MAFHFHCSFLAVHRFKRRVVADGRLVAWFYVRHGSFLVDLLSILPILELVPAAPGPPPPPPPSLSHTHAPPPWTPPSARSPATPRPSPEPRSTGPPHATFAPLSAGRLAVACRSLTSQSAPPTPPPTRTPLRRQHNTTAIPVAAAGMRPPKIAPESSQGEYYAIYARPERTARVCSVHSAAQGVVVACDNRDVEDSWAVLGLSLLRVARLMRLYRLLQVRWRRLNILRAVEQSARAPGVGHHAWGPAT